MAKLRIIQLFVLIFFISTKTEAQVNMGVLGGLNLSNSDGQNFCSSNRIGLQVGGFLTYHFTDHIAIQSELSFNITRLRSKNVSSDHPTKYQKERNLYSILIFPYYSN